MFRYIKLQTCCKDGGHALRSTSHRVADSLLSGLLPMIDFSASMASVLSIE